MANETAQIDPKDLAGAGDADLPVNTYAVVPTARIAVSDLYSFRDTIAGEPEAAPWRLNAGTVFRPILMLGGFAALGVVLVFAVTKLIQPKGPALYIDLGTQRFAPAGLDGRLIARWDDGPAFQLSIDPADEQETAAFAAVAQDPPLPLSVTLHIRDSAGRVTCQKQILFPAPAQATAAGSAQALAPQKTASGDTVQNVAGEDGQISEIDITGGLGCPLKAYEHLTAWDFSTNFPTLAGQGAWLKHEDELALSRRPHSAGAGLFQTQHLAAPIEGDDVIVGDNPSRGTIETSDGRLFLIGAGSWRNRTTEWQVFPAAIHFRCDKSGLCVLMRANSHTTLQARLLK